MPAPSRTSADAILTAARELLAAGGADAVSMHAIARVVGVRAPSLYKHFADRADVMERLALEGFESLAQRLTDAVQATDPFTAMAATYRAFANESPAQYLHMMSAQASTAPAVDQARQRAAAPVLGYLMPRVGAERALTVARLVTAFLHGFISMELNGAFRLGGDPAADFHQGVAMLRALVTAEEQRT